MRCAGLLYLALPIYKPYTENGSTVYQSRILGRVFLIIGRFRIFRPFLARLTGRVV